MQTEIESTIIATFNKLGHAFVPAHIIAWATGIIQEEIDPALDALVDTGVLERGRFRQDAYRLRGR